MATSKKPTTHQVYNPNTKILNINNGQKIKNVATGQVFGTKNGLTPQQQAGRASLRAGTPVPQKVKSPTTHQVYKNGSLISTPLINPNAPKTPPKAGPYYEAPVPIGARDKVNTSGKNWFTNQSTGIKHNTLTGQYVNQAGEYVNADGSLIEPTQEPVASYADIGKANIQSEYDANLGAELDLTGQASGYKSMEEYFKDQYAALKENTAMQKEQYDAQKEQIGQQTGQQVNAIQGQVGSMAPSREGAATSSYDRLQEVAGTQIQRLQQAQDLSMKSIEQLKTNLDRAERAGDTELAQQYRSQLLSAESQAQKTETDLVNALTSQASTQAALKQSSIQTFQGLIDDGQDLSVETISSFANELGVPFEAAYGYYAGAQAIRDDKTLSLEEKQVALDQAKQDLNDQITGMDTQAAQAIKGLQTLRQQGASEEAIAAYKSAAGITDYDDPLTQAELAYNQAKSKIAYNEANGIITSPLDMIDLAQKTYDYYSQIGYTAGSVPTGGEYGATSYTLENGLPAIMVNVQQGQSLDIPETRDRDEGQCGAFVNDYFGEKMMGNLFTQKMGLVDKSIQVPEPGMAFVMETESSYGHTGIVEYVDPSRGVMGIVDANWNNDGKVRRTEIPISDATGFVRAPNAMPADAVITLEAVDKDLRSAVTTKANQFDAEPLVRNFQTIQEGKNYLDSLDPNNLTSSDNQSIIYAFAKIMDPNSVVRESEYETVQRYAQSLASTYGFNAERILANTEFLTPEAVQNMIKTVQGRYDASKQSYDQFRNEYVRSINNLAGGVNIGDSILQNYITPTNIGGQEDLGVLYDQYSDYSFSQNNLWDSLPNK